MKNPKFISVHKYSGLMMVNFKAITELNPNLKTVGEFQAQIYFNDQDDKNETEEFGIDLDLCDGDGFELNGKVFMNPGGYGNKTPESIEYNNNLEFVQKMYNIKIWDITETKIKENIKRMGVKEFINKYTNFKVK